MRYAYLKPKQIDEAFETIKRTVGDKPVYSIVVDKGGVRIEFEREPEPEEVEYYDDGVEFAFWD